MNRERVKEIILNIIADIYPEVEAMKVDPAVRLRDQLDLDSMDFLDIVMALRKEHGIEVPEPDYPQLATLESCADYLLPKFESTAAR
ncbi:MAG: acyl carrier protein [Opitutales bacterium]